MTNSAVVLLNWNGWRDTLACLDSLFADGATPCRVLVCDNASKDESVAQLRAWALARFGDRFVQLTRTQVDAGAQLAPDAALALIENGGNLGFAAGNNVGIRLALRDARCDFVWVLNNDTVVQPDALGRAVERMRADPAIGLCGSTLIYFDEPEKVQALGGACYSRWTGRSRHVGAFGPRSEVPADGAALEPGFSYVVGAAMLASRAFLEQVGLMREDYFLYYEEIDWATRGAGRFRLGYAPASVVLHKEGASIGTSASGGSPLSLYFLYRNRLRFSWRFHRAFIVTVVSSCLLDIARLAARGRWPQVRAALRGVFQVGRGVAPGRAAPPA
jgi:hypothetical protein